MALLDHWNARHALTALPPGHRFEELVQDACALLPYLTGLPPGSKLADFGTGMGVPAIILAIARPDLEIHAVDKSKKKIAFVRQAALELSLGNLIPIAGRSEDLPPIGADLGTAKAVGSLPLLTNWWSRHSKPGAPLLLLKSEEGASEPCPSGWKIECRTYRLPTRGNRIILRLEKEPDR
ncbi:MAG: class I SAM-dependent methyltransferase [Holophaga sp.]|nr:class I SAM-dependent methyltransferase [Holophaga sp.]